jgi:hypothetical protein
MPLFSSKKSGVRSQSMSTTTGTISEPLRPKKVAETMAPAEMPKRRIARALPKSAPTLAKTKRKR